MEILAAIVGGSFGAAIVSLVQFLIGRHDKKKAGVCKAGTHGAAAERGVQALDITHFITAKILL